MPREGESRDVGAGSDAEGRRELGTWAPEVMPREGESRGRAGGVPDAVCPLVSKTATTSVPGYANVPNLRGATAEPPASLSAPASSGSRCQIGITATRCQAVVIRDLPKVKQMSVKCLRFELELRPFRLQDCRCARCAYCTAQLPLHRLQWMSPLSHTIT